MKLRKNNLIVERMENGVGAIQMIKKRRKKKVCEIFYR
jgi:hypothetical protein